MSGGKGVCHYASNTVPEAWERIEQNNNWYRGGKHTLGQYYYFSPEALRKMYERCGLHMLEQHQESWDCKCIFEKPTLNIVPRLELLLQQLISQRANDDTTRAAIVTALQALPGQLEQTITPLLAEAQNEPDLYKRVGYAARIRRIWRGL